MKIIKEYIRALIQEDINPEIVKDMIKDYAEQFVGTKGSDEGKAQLYRMGIETNNDATKFYVKGELVAKAGVKPGPGGLKPIVRFRSDKELAELLN